MEPFPDNKVIESANALCASTAILQFQKLVVGVLPTTKYSPNQRGTEIAQQFDTE